MRVNQCCCGCSLRGGTLAIGYYYTIVGFIAAVMFFVVNSVIHDPEPYESNETTKANIRLARGILIGAGVVMLIQTLAAISLLFGVYKGKTGIMLPWLIINGIYLLLGVAGIILVIVLGSTSGQPSIISSVVGQCIYVALLFYFLVVVHSYRKSVLEGSVGPVNP